MGVTVPIDELNIVCIELCIMLSLSLVYKSQIAAVISWTYGMNF